jgi:transposase
MHFISHIHRLTGTQKKLILEQIGLRASTYHNWLHRLENQRLTDAKPVGRNPYRLLDWEKEAIRDFYLENGENGYRRITYMMIDQDIVYTSPSTVYRFLKSEGLLMRWAQPHTIGPKPSLPRT